MAPHGCALTGTRRSFDGSGKPVKDTEWDAMLDEVRACVHAAHARTFARAEMRCACLFVSCGFVLCSFAC